MSLATNLQPNVVRNFVVLDQTTNKLEVGIARSRVCDLDLLHSTLHQLPEKDRLLLNGHWVGKGLITIPQIC
jgi:hypothetical protein